MQKSVNIIKANGEREPFSESKLVSSLERAGAGASEVVSITEHIKKELEEDMTTDHIYRHAFGVLKDLKNPGVLRRYSLRHALIELGPTGFPFEKYLSELFKTQGYEVLTDQTVMGRCVSHEIDVIAYNESKLLMVEAKFHNQYGEKTDLKVALYVKARFDDLAEQQFNYGKRRGLDEAWLVTNTKFTENAIRYGECAGLKMVGWNYPSKGNIQELIEDARLHPITCLPGLSVTERGLLLNSNMILCKQVLNASSALTRLGIDQKKALALETQAQAICGI